MIGFGHQVVPRLMPIVLAALFTGGASVGALVGCSGKQLSLGRSCTLNSDCTDPLSCKFGKCHRQCAETRDCSTGEVCIKVDGIGVCQSISELTCTDTEGCPSPLVCGPSNTCGSVCREAADCLGGQSCLASVCVEVSTPVIDAAGGGDAGSGTTDTARDLADTGAADAATGTCTVGTARASDSFEGSSLGPAWNQQAIGTPPTFTISGGALHITDASLAATPSMPLKSWIYDLDVDLGNQMTWPQPIGTGDFDLSFDLTINSTIPQLTFAGVALTNASGQIEVFGAAQDGLAAADGGFSAWVHKPKMADASPLVDTAAVATAAFHIQRSGGVVVVQVDGKTVVTEPNGADIRNLALVSVKHMDTAATYEFGSVDVGEIVLCY